jgi:hypothetical protein
MFADLLAWYTTLLKSNPIAAGFVSMYGLGVATFVLRNIPARIWAFIKRNGTTTLYINNTAVGSNMESFNNFLRWYEGSYWARFSRTLSLNGGWMRSGTEIDSGTVVGIGDGSHFCMYKRRPVWVHRKRLDNNQSAHQLNYEISITVLGRRRKLINELIEEFRYRDTEGTTGVFMYDREWKRVGEVQQRPLHTVIMDPATKAKLVERVDAWLQAKQWHHDRGFIYKLTIMLHGIPGSGKSSLIRAMASHYKRDLCFLHLASHNDASLRDALMTAPARAIIAVEDFDDVTAIHARRGFKTGLYQGRLPNPKVTLDEPAGPGPGIRVSEVQSRSNEEEGEPDNDLLKMGVTLSGMLQCLDGVLSLDGKILCLSTNRPEVFDQALVRKGRINETFEIGALQSPQIHEYITLMYPDLDYDRSIQFEAIAGCDLEDHYLQTLNAPHALIDALPKAQPRLSLIQCE